MANPTIGLALGSGSARGWAHIGAIRVLEEHGLRPGVVCGSSVGALVGAAYASGNLDALERWVRELSFWDVVRLMDVRLDGGLIQGDTLMNSFREKILESSIEGLPLPFAAVATDLATGREFWLQSGSLLNAVRAAIALPGLFAPIRKGHHWLVDGGLVNPVPVSLCRALGAEVIIAVNLNGDILGRHLAAHRTSADEMQPVEEDRALFDQLVDRLHNGLREHALSGWRRRRSDENELPGMFEVLASAINIMQDRITRGRMAADPPDVLISPQVGQLGLMEFDRAETAIAEGRKAAEKALPMLKTLLANESGKEDI